MSQNIEMDNCGKVLQKIFPGGTFRKFYAQGGILAEVVHRSITDANVASEHRRLMQAMIDFNGNNPLEQRFVFHSIFFYPQADNRFQIGSLLHTRKADYDDNGIFTSYLDAGDENVWVTELDKEVLQFGVDKHTFDIVADKIPNSISVTHVNAGYKQIGIQGGYYSIVAMKQVSESTWQITVEG